MDIQFSQQALDGHDYDSPVAFTGSVMLPAKPKRMNHNELERKRRYHQKERLSELKDAIPTLQMERPSTVLIMQKAKEYIDVLKQRCDEMEHDMVRMRQALMQLTAQNQNQRAMMSGFSGREGGVEGETLRRENMELRNQLSQLEKKLTKSNSVESHHVKLEWPQQTAMTNHAVDNNGMNMWPTPSPMANASHHQQAGHAHAHVARNLATTSSQPNNHPAQHLSKNTNRISTDPRIVNGTQPSPMPLGTTGTIAPGHPASGHSQISSEISNNLNVPVHQSSTVDMSSHLRKRKSLVDHEYDDMQGFYGRRDSTIEALEAMRGAQMHPSNSAPTARQVDSSIPDKRNVLPSLMLPMLTSVASALHEEAYGSEEVKCQVCSGGLEGLIMLDCDKCHNWYHGQCVGVDSKNIPSSWVCDPCSIGKRA